VVPELSQARRTPSLCFTVPGCRHRKLHAYQPILAGLWVEHADGSVRFAAPLLARSPELGKPSPEPRPAHGLRAGSWAGCTSLRAGVALGPVDPQYHVERPAGDGLLPAARRAPPPAHPGRHPPRAGAPGRATARPPRPGCGSRSPPRGPRPAPRCVPVFGPLQPPRSTADPGQDSPTRLDPLVDRHPPNRASRVQEAGRHSGPDGSILTGTI
jgi:hypothetical protein